MTKRLLWNFEIDESTRAFSGHLENTSTPKDKHILWEYRSFWKEKDIINLPLPREFLALNHFEHKIRQDIYYLLPHENLNIKLRKDKLHYKPLVEVKGHLAGFAKKIKLKEFSDNSVLPQTSHTKNTLIKAIENHAIKAQIYKEAFLYTWPEQEVRLELARLSIKDLIYFSVGIEGYDSTIVQNMASCLPVNGNNCHYVSFLKKLWNISC